MKEIAIFVVILAILVTILGAVINLLGGSFGLNIRESWYLAFVALVFVVPAVLNIYEFASGNGSENAAQRVLALIRGVGMMIAGLACAIPVITNIASRGVFLWGFGVGALMNFATLPIEDYLDRRRRQQVTATRAESPAPSHPFRECVPLRLTQDFQKGCLVRKTGSDPRRAPSRAGEGPGSTTSSASDQDHHGGRG